MRKYCITFAWAVWSSKAPITNYISTKFNLPVFNNDAVRSEIIEDVWFLDINEHIKRRNERLIDKLNLICKKSYSMIEKEAWYLSYVLLKFI